MGPEQLKRVRSKSSMKRHFGYFFKLGCILYDERIKLPCVEVARKRREREREREEEISRCAKKEESFLQQASLSIPSASTRNKKL